MIGPLARPLAQPIAKSLLAGAGGGSSNSYDADAQDYFARAEALGGSFNQSAISGTYTEAYVKSAISDFVAGCKTDLIWTKLLEVYLFSGVSFGGVLAKLKYISAAASTNANFVSGDYVAAGSGAGLAGNAANKRIATGQNYSDGVAVDDLHLSMYVTSARSTTTGFPAEISGYGADAATTFTGLVTYQISDSTYSFWSGGYYDATKVAVFGTGFMVGVSKPGTAGTASAILYKNGTSVASNLNKSTSGRSIPTLAMQLFCGNQNGSFSRFTDSRLALVTKGTALTDTDVANLSARVNALLTALGANVY